MVSQTMPGDTGSMQNLTGAVRVRLLPLMCHEDIKVTRLKKWEGKLPPKSRDFTLALLLLELQYLEYYN